jgi:hypothetical protein
MDLASDPTIQRIARNEFVRGYVRGVEAQLLVTDERVAVAAEERIALDVSLRGIRRIQFDIERERPATLVIVPDDPRHEAQVITVPPEEYAAVGSVLEFVGRRIHDIAS